MASKRPKKKVVLLIVEGISDIEALSAPLEQLFDNMDESIEIHFCTMKDDLNPSGGDITSKYGVTPEKIEGLIYKLCVHDFLIQNRLMSKDIYKVIQIVDMDGAYLPDKNVVAPNDSEPVCEKAIYSSSNIVTNNIDNILDRNKRKRDNLNHLISMYSIKIDSKTVPYLVFFFSCNLDHYLYDKANLPACEKRTRAEEFSLSCMEDIEVFLRRMCKHKCALSDMSYEESWHYIRTDSNSIKRHTNINNLISSIVDTTI